MTEPSKNDINEQPSGVNHTAKAERHKKWSQSIGMGGRDPPESLVAIIGMRSKGKLRQDQVCIWEVWMAKRRVLFLIYDDVEVLDFTGPFDVFSMANIVGAQKQFEMFTVGPDGNPVKTIHGLSINPDYGVENCPMEALDILVIPGGEPSLMFEFDRKYPRVIDWIASSLSRTQVLATVCVGALIGAKAGLFEGLKATTHHGFLRQLEEFSNGNATIVPGARYIDNDGIPEIISSSGVSAGIDMAFYLLGKLEGNDMKQKTAAIMEYNATTNWTYEK